MGKLIFIIFGFLVLILALGAVSFWQAPDLSNPESLQTIVPKLQEISALGNKAGEDQYQKFTSSDGKFKIEYPSGWLALKDENLLRAMVPQEWFEKYELKTLILAQNFNGGFAQMTVYKGIFDISIKEIFEKMTETNKANGWTIEVIKMEDGENEGLFEGKYKNQAGALLYSKEKILMAENEGYLISVFAPEKDWQASEEIIDKILNSAIIKGL